jgi:hypothetical protein
VVSSDGGLICACGQQENSDDHDDHDGPFRVGRSWGVTVVYDPHFDPDAATKTGVLWATTIKPIMAREIVAALNTMATTQPAPDATIPIPDGPFRHGSSWALTVVYDPTGATKTGIPWALAQTLPMATQIVSALNLSHATNPRRLEEEYGPARDLARALAAAPTCGTEIVDGWLCARPILNGVCPDHGQVR